MKKCLIITSYIEGNLTDLIDDFDPDFILCADGGYNHAKAAGIKPDLLIGDMDSIDISCDPDAERIVYPAEKDDTDTGICLQTALDRGYRDILIAGGLGGRLDHTFSNIELITGKIGQADSITIKDKSNACTVIRNSSLTLNKGISKYVSIFSMTEKSTGVSLSGFKYPLDNVELTFGSTLGTSNEITADKAVASVTDGILLIIFSDESKGGRP